MQLYFMDLWSLWFLLPGAGCFFLLRRRGVRFWQGMMILCLILAASGPVLRWTGTEPETLLLTERIPGVKTDIPADLQRRAGVRQRDYTGSTAAALADAGAGFRSGNGGEIHLFSTFHETSGSVSRSAAALNRRNIRVIAHSQTPEKIRRPVLRGLSCNPAAGCGERIRLEAELAVPHPSETELKLCRADGRVLTSRRIASRPDGLSRTSLEFSLSEPGEYALRLELDGAAAAEIHLAVSAPYRAVLISAQPELELPALRELFRGAEIELREPSRKFSSAALLVIGEGGVRTLKASELKELAETVKNGAGLLYFAGTDIPFAEEKLPSAFRELLPVRYAGKNLNRMPTTALAIIIDTSGSMSGTRLALARETARLALDKLRDCDMAGIVEFHGRRRWAAPLQSAANHLELHRALNRLNAGGGTVILPALQEAFYALRNADARLKHVLIITDGGVEQGDFEGLLRRMAENDITVSTVMTGSGQSPFLSRLAWWGGGRFYTASSRFALPELAFRQSGRESLPPFRTGPFSPEVHSGWQLFSGLSSVPSVPGVLENTLASGAEEAIRAGQQPLIALRRAGAGMVCAVNTGLSGDVMQNFYRQPAVAGMFSALGRSLPDPVRMQPFAVRDYSVLQDIHFRFERAGQIPYLYAELSAPSGKTERYRLERAADQTFHFRRYGLPEGTYHLKISETADMRNPLQFPFDSFAAPASGWTAEDHRTAEEITRRSLLLPEPGAAIRQFYLRPVFGGLFILLMLVQLLLRRLPSRLALTAGLLCVSCLVFGGEYETQLKNGLLGHQPETAFRLAAEKARTASDLRFALLLELETARNHGHQEELLRRWSALSAMEPERLELLVNACEDAGQPERALAVLKQHGGGLDGRFAPTLIRLAEKCGRSDLLRTEIQQQLKRNPRSMFLLNAAFRLELLAGRRAAAEELLDQRLKTENDPAVLRLLAESAEKAALYSCAERILRKEEQVSAEGVWPARFRRMDLAVHRGDPAGAVKLLRSFAAEKNLSRGILLNLADRCEQYGDSVTALELYRRAGSEDARIRAAMLLEGLGRNPEAAKLWNEVFRTSENEMRARQAMERLLDLSAAAGKLPETAAALEQKLKQKPSLRLKTFYAHVLFRANRLDELFHYLDLQEKNGETGLAGLKLSFLLSARRYKEASALLEQKKTADPEKRAEILRHQVLIAVEAGDKTLAHRAADELLRIAPRRADALEFAAGVYSLLNEPAKAVEMYDECLKENPSRIELYLLRAKAQKAAGAGRRAQAFFVEKLREPVSADFFGIAADGLLDLNVPKEVLRQVLAETMKRLNADPELLFYYRLAEDLAEELGDRAVWRHLQLLQLAAAPERRTLLLRGLYEDAVVCGRRKDSFRLARLLSGWNEIYPPELYRSLSGELTENGFFAAAERCVRQADAAENSSRHLFALTQVCLDAGRPADAARICRELLSLSPDSPEYLIRYAEVLEISGEYRRAGEQNLRALSLLASRMVLDQGQGKGSSSAVFERQIRPVICAFANQFVLCPGVFDAELAVLEKTAGAAARRRVWNPLRKRMNALTGLPVPSAVRRNAVPGSRPVPADVLAYRLAVLPETEAVKEVEQTFRKLSAGQRSPYWERLVGSLCAEPPARVSAVLERELTRLTFRNTGIRWQFSAYGLALKRKYAELFLKKFPESLHALSLAAQIRYLTGDPAGARLLAGEVYERFAGLVEVKFPEYRAGLELNRIFAAADSEAENAGKHARSELQASVESDRKLLGDTPARTLTAVLLLKGEGKYDAALDELFRLWKNGERGLVVFRLSEELTVRTGRYREWLELLSSYETKDVSVRVLAARRQVQLFRDVGEYQRARQSLPMLAVPLQKRERLLTERFMLSPERFAAGLRSFLIGQCRTGQFVGFYADSFGTDGLTGYRLRGGRRANLLPELAVRDRALNDTLGSLLRGTPVAERGFAVLFEAWRNTLPGNGNPHSAGTEKTVPALLAMRTVSGGSYHAGEIAMAEKLIRNSAVPVENAVIFLDILPRAGQSSAAAGLAERVLQSPQPSKQRELLESLLKRMEPQKRRAVLLRLASLIPENDCALRVFWLGMTRTYEPSLLPEMRGLLCRPAVFPADTELYLLYGQGSAQERILRFLTVAERYPDWQILFLIPDETEKQSLADAAEKALETALRRGLLPEDELVRHYVLLSVADPVRKAYWQTRAALHDRQPGESSLWRLDSLENPAERAALLKKLSSAGRLPPQRRNTNQNPVTGKESLQ